MIHLVYEPIRGSSISANETCRADKASTQLPQQQSGQCRLAPGSYVTVFGPDPSSGGLLPTPSRHTRSALGLTLEHPIGSESLKFGDGLIFVVGFTGANETDWSESRLNCPPSTSPALHQLTCSYRMKPAANDLESRSLVTTSLVLIKMRILCTLIKRAGGEVS
ncbi:hypothetical protein CPSG_04513 [Coccidioides posadasii str. Silveira]|uniref:Uncharacterized protein n=1 Tax=Coccidioides posadasii (strain RMSCC 757 / Silveira) TaxID=443226 RepID=E9D4H4_COCPS|nr:hypothetical protein CPSG_04513 [Coccidioides posadasii str. Silveira]